MSKKAKAADKKLRRKQNQEKHVKADKIQFDIINLLAEEPLTTKPEVGEFLKKYVKCIRVLVDHSKIIIYPIQEYIISKVFIDFLDGHQIIADFKRQPREYYMWFNLDEVMLKEHHLKLVINFVQKLQEFSFIH